MINQTVPHSDPNSLNANQKIKIIKRYQNRKLYDTGRSCYVTLHDIAKMVRANEEVKVIDNKSKNDITAATLTMIAFEAEKHIAVYAPISALREIIQHENGSLTNFLLKLGAFPEEYLREQAALALAKIVSNDLQQNQDLAARFTTAKDVVEAIINGPTPVLPAINENEVPSLPMSIVLPNSNP